MLATFYETINLAWIVKWNSEMGISILFTLYPHIVVYPFSTTNQLLIGLWCICSCTLQHSIKNLTHMPGLPAIVTKGEFIKIMLKLLRPNSTLMGTSEPSFRKRNISKAIRKHFTIAGLYFVIISMFGQWTVSFPTISDNLPAWLYILEHKRKHADSSKIFNMATRTRPAFFTRTSSFEIK